MNNLPECKELPKNMWFASECDGLSFNINASIGPDSELTDEEVEELGRIWEEANE